MIDYINEGCLILHFNSINQLTRLKMYIISALKLSILPTIFFLTSVITHHINSPYLLCEIFIWHICCSTRNINYRPRLFLSWHHFQVLDFHFQCWSTVLFLFVSCFTHAVVLKWSWIGLMLQKIKMKRRSKHFGVSVTACWYENGQIEGIWIVLVM